MPFFPPMLASIIATKVVGIAMKGIPRQCVAATKPAISKITPPPTPIKVACLGTLRSVSCWCKDRKVSPVLVSSPSGMVSVSTENPSERAKSNRGGRIRALSLVLVIKMRGKSVDNEANSLGFCKESTR
ncbi:Uncharacterised protein [Chlamydia trachomatis]|nr:Uncharacterised protein [Chlamydia trachomatis]